MDEVMSLLREKRKIRDAEYFMHESQQLHEHTSRENELEELKDQTHQYVETIGKNYNFITSHRHAISKAAHETKRFNGLPFSNKCHKPTLDFMNDAVAFLNNGKKLFTKPDTTANIDSCQLSADVQSCAESTAEVLKATQSSLVKVEMFMQNIHVILDRYNDDEPLLETSIFDE